MRKFSWPKAALVCAAGALATVITAVTPEDSAAQTSRSGGSRGQSEAQRRAQARQAGPQADPARGMREAPAVVQSAGLGCTVTEAAYLGSLTSGAAVYEVACREGLGFVVTSAPTAGGAPQAIDCINQNATAAQQPAVRACRLPGNAQPAQGLQSALAAAGVSCTVNNARYLGDNLNTRMTRYEVGCAQGAGYVLERPKGTGTPTAMSCFRASAGGNFQCQYTTREQSLAPLAAAAAASRRPCTVTNARMVGTNPTTRNEVYEIGCAPGQAGFFIETAANGSFVEARDCGRFAEPCQFTAATVVAERNAADYSRLLREASFDCAVSNFNRLGAERGTRREIVEVACSNRPDGAFAFLATGAGQRSEIFDCLLAPKLQQQCRLTQPEALYPKVSAAITAAQKSNCTVVDDRRVGTTTQGEDWYEFSCSQGRNALVDYRGNGRVGQVVRCAEGAGILGGCKLPVPVPGRR